MSTDADAAVASPLLSGAGGRGHFRGVGKDLPWPLHSGRFLPPLLALGFSDGYEACPAPAPPGASLLSSNRTGPQLPAQTQVAPGRWGGGQSSDHGGPEWPQTPPGTRSWVPGPPPSTLVPRRPHLVLQISCARHSFCFFFSSPPHPSPPRPGIFFLCINRTLLVRKQYHFRSKEERDMNLVEGKFSFTV